MDNDMSSVALNFRRNVQVCPERNKNAAVDEVKLLPIWVPTRMCVNKEVDPLRFQPCGVNLVQS